MNVPTATVARRALLALLTLAITGGAAPPAIGKPKDLSVPPLVVVDGAGTILGHYLGKSIVSMEIDGFRVDAQIAAPNEGIGDVYYTTEDCTGTAYWFIPDHNTIHRDGRLANGVLVFATAPALNREARSYQTIESSAPSTYFLSNCNGPIEMPFWSAPASIVPVGPPPYSVR